MVSSDHRLSAPAGTREVVVRPRNARRETIGVLTAVLAIILLMALRFSLIGGDEAQQYLRPYQRLDTMLQGAQRTLYQSLLASVPEIVDLRDEEGMWPEAELLEMDMIPPFDGAFLPSGLQDYRWTGHDGGSWVDYVGHTPEEVEPYTYLLRIVDLHAEYHPHPHPGVDYDPNRRVAVQVWIYPEPVRPYPGERLPEAGWWWIVSPGDPSLSAPPDGRANYPGAPAAGPESERIETP